VTATEKNQRCMVEKKNESHLSHVYPFYNHKQWCDGMGGFRSVCTEAVWKERPLVTLVALGTLLPERADRLLASENGTGTSQGSVLQVTAVFVLLESIPDCSQRPPSIFLELPATVHL